MKEEYIKLGDLKVYQLALGLCNFAWKIYKDLNWHDKKIQGGQFIRSVDSVAANIAEGYGRYHYLDRIKFYYNARGSLLEAKNWSFLMSKREIISKDAFSAFINMANNLHAQLNIYIGSCYPQKVESGSPIS